MTRTRKAPLALLFILSVLAVSLTSGAAANGSPSPISLSLDQVGRASDEGVEATAEISAYVVRNNRSYATDPENNEIDVFSWANPESPVYLFSIPLSSYGVGPNSVTYTPAFGGAVAVAVENGLSRGSVELFSLAGRHIQTYQAGWLPDMVTTTRGGWILLVANEGEPQAEGSALALDPPGTVTVIDLLAAKGVPNRATVREATFDGVTVDPLTRIFLPDSTVQQDLEPEYITALGDTAWVSIQEANAIAVLDIPTATFSFVKSLGFKDHSIEGNGLDASDRDDPDGKSPWAPTPNIRTHERLFGMYQPDAIASFRLPGADGLIGRAVRSAINSGRSQIYAAGRTAFLEARGRGVSKSAASFIRYQAEVAERESIAREARSSVNTDFVVTANEGDARDWPFYSEESRVGSLSLSGNFNPAAKTNLQLGRLNVTKTLGQIGPSYDSLYAFGARSMSVLDRSGDMVADTGDQLEQLSLELDPANFNKSNTAGSPVDDRSDNKGPEPEAVVTGYIGGKVYAFVAAERSGMIYAFDVSTDPEEPAFAGWTNTRETDLGPEGIVFIKASDSPTGSPAILVTYEISGTQTLYEIELLG